MPIETELLTDDPIILTTIYGDFTAADAREIFRFTANILDDYEGTIYRIHDIRAADMTFPSVIGVIQEARKLEAGSSLDERVQMVMVGYSGMFDIARAAYTQSGKNIPVFDTVQTAIKGIQIGMLGK